MAAGFTEPGKSGVLKGFVEPVMQNPIKHLRRMLEYSGGGEEELVERAIEKNWMPF